MPRGCPKCEAVIGDFWVCKSTQCLNGPPMTDDERRARLMDLEWDDGQKTPVIWCRTHNAFYVLPSGLLACLYCGEAP